MCYVWGVNEQRNAMNTTIKLEVGMMVHIVKHGKSQGTFPIERVTETMAIVGGAYNYRLRRNVGNTYQGDTVYLSLVRPRMWAPTFILKSSATA